MPTIKSPSGGWKAMRDAGRIPLYGSLPLNNGSMYRDGFVAWLYSSLDAFLSPNKHTFHTTVCYSKEPISVKDVHLKMALRNIKLEPDIYNEREITKLGEATVLLLGQRESEPIVGIWNMFKSIGASWDFPEYRPHISLSYECAIPVHKIPPFRGALQFNTLAVDEIRDNADNGHEHIINTKYKGEM